MTSADWTKPSEGIEAQTYGRNKQSERDEIARQMAEYESTRKVETIPIGASKDNNFQESETNSEKRTKGTLSSMKAPKAGGEGLADFRGLKTQKQRKQEWKETGIASDKKPAKKIKNYKDFKDVSKDFVGLHHKHGEDI